MSLTTIVIGAGAAILGIVGLDYLLKQSGTSINEPLSQLGYGLGDLGKGVGGAIGGVGTGVGQLGVGIGAGITGLLSPLGFLASLLGNATGIGQKNAPSNGASASSAPNGATGGINLGQGTDESGVTRGQTIWRLG